MWSWDPFREMKRIQRQMDSLFDSSFRHGGHPLVESKAVMTPEERFRLPTCDIQETDKSVIASFEIPGADKKDIQLNVDKNEIEVKVEKSDEKELNDEKKGLYSYSRSSSQFYRRIPLMLDLDSEKAEASYSNGILKVEVPKLKQLEEKRKMIEIK